MIIYGASRWSSMAKQAENSPRPVIRLVIIYEHLRRLARIRAVVCRPARAMDLVSCVFFGPRSGFLRPISCKRRVLSTYSPADFRLILGSRQLGRHRLYERAPPIVSPRRVAPRSDRGRCGVDCRHRHRFRHVWPSASYRRRKRGRRG